MGRGRSLPTLVLTDADPCQCGCRAKARPMRLIAGKVISQLRRRHRSLEFHKLLDTIRANVPAALDVHLVMDN
jgi:hypothetical protein